MFTYYHHITTSKHKSYLDTHRYYIEITTKPSHAHMNMGNYLQQGDITNFNSLIEFFFLRAPTEDRGGDGYGVHDALVQGGGRQIGNPAAAA
jgi:hypothetical protein